MSKEITFEVKDHVGVLSPRKSNGYRKELNLVSWNGNSAKYDVRDWCEDYEKMTKGITLTEDEAKMLRVLLNYRNELKGEL